MLLLDRFQARTGFWDTPGLRLVSYDGSIAAPCKVSAGCSAQNVQNVKIVHLVYVTIYGHTIFWMILHFSSQTFCGLHLTYYDTAQLLSRSLESLKNMQSNPGANRGQTRHQREKKGNSEARKSNTLLPLESPFLSP